MSHFQPYKKRCFACLTSVLTNFACNTTVHAILCISLVYQKPYKSETRGIMNYTKLYFAVQPDMGLLYHLLGMAQILIFPADHQCME